MKIVTLFFSLTLFLFAQPKEGGYKSFDEFQSNTPSVPARWQIEQFTPEAAEKGTYGRLVHYDSLTANYRKWKRMGDGKILAYVDSSSVYYNYRGVLSKLTLSEEYAWFYGLDEVIGDDIDVNPGDSEWYEELILLNLKTGKRKYLSPREVKKMIKSNKELLEAYENEKPQREKMTEYLERFFVEVK